MTVKEGGSDSAPADVLASEPLRGSKLRTPYAEVHKDACGLKLFRIVGERLIACESVRFLGGRPEVIRALLLARIAGRAEWEGKIENHFADVLIDDDETWDGTVALDAKSYGALKNKWMKCKLERAE